MHFKYVVRQLGLLMVLLSASMLFSAAVALFLGQQQALYALLWSIAVGGIGGGLLILLGGGDSRDLGRREAMLLVSVSWFGGGLLAALPFYLWARSAQVTEFQSFVNCYFEAMSGLTTTGATVLSNVADVPRSLLFWRAFTHWLGGLGIVVLFVAVLPLLGVGGKRLFRIETTGVSGEGATPRIAETARVLWLIYLGMTAAETVLLWAVDERMDLLTALMHTFATLATGGFSTVNASAGGFSPAAQWVMIAFMFLAGINFALYHLVIRGRLWQALRDTELHAYVLILLIGALLVALSIYGSQYSDTAGHTVQGEGGRVARDAVFQVVSIQTTTGFCTADFNQWHYFSKALLVALMFVGGCGGSTGGGIKVIRIVVAAKVMWSELERAFRPNVVRPVRVGSATIDDGQRLAILSYVLGIVFIFVIGTALLVLTEQNISEVTAATAIIACLNNIGPGLDAVGAVENYGWFSDSSKLLMCILMAVGRLEVLPVLVIFMPRFWRSH